MQVVKKPGLEATPVVSEMDLTYKERYGDTHIPEAYERLILDAIRGDQQHFVRRWAHWGACSGFRADSRFSYAAGVTLQFDRPWSPTDPCCRIAGYDGLYLCNMHFAHGTLSALCDFCCPHAGMNCGQPGQCSRPCCTPLTRVRCPCCPTSMALAGLLSPMSWWPGMGL